MRMDGSDEANSYYSHFERDWKDATSHENLCFKFFVD